VLGEVLDVIDVDLEAMAMALGNLAHAVDFGDAASRRQHRG